MIPRRVSLLILAVLLLGAAHHQPGPRPGRAAAHARISRPSSPAPTRAASSPMSSSMSPTARMAPRRSSRSPATGRPAPTTAVPRSLLHAFNRVPLAAGALQISGELEAVTVQGSGPVRPAAGARGRHRLAGPDLDGGRGRSPATSMRKGNASGRPRPPGPCAPAPPTSPPRSPSTPPSRSGDHARVSHDEAWTRPLSSVTVLGRGCGGSGGRLRMNWAQVHGSDASGARHGDN